MCRFLVLLISFHFYAILHFLHKQNKNDTYLLQVIAKADTDDKWPQNGRKVWIYTHHLFTVHVWGCMLPDDGWDYCMYCTHKHTHTQACTCTLKFSLEHTYFRQSIQVSPIILIVNTATWYVQGTSRTVSLSNQHLITFNVCVWTTTKAWLTAPGTSAHLQHHQGTESKFYFYLLIHLYYW